MLKRRPRVSGVTLLAAAVLILLPALAWLQYSWLDQIAVADRERRERTLRTAVSQLSLDFEGEVGKAISGLQIDSAMAEQKTWTDYASRYQAWAEAAMAPAIVKNVYFVDDPEPRGDVKSEGAHTARVEAGGRHVQAIDWPADLLQVQPLRSWRDDRRQGRGDSGPRGFERMLLPPDRGPATSNRSCCRSFASRRPDRSAPGLPPRPPDMRLLGFTIIRLNLAALGN